MGRSDDDMGSGHVRAIELKQAMAADVAECGRSRLAIAEDCGVSRQALDGWIDVHVDSHIPGSRQTRFIKATNGVNTLKYQCAQVGLYPVPLPTASAEPVDICATADLADSFASALRHHAQASRDGRWTATEIADTAPVLVELAARAMALKAHIERQGKDVLPMRRSS